MEELVRTAERILSGSFGRYAALRPERVWDGGKSTVVRCRLLDAASPAPSSVIVKRSKYGAILEDWAASLFLEQVPREPLLAPRCYGGDLPAQVIVLEDLGDGEGLGTAVSHGRVTGPGRNPLECVRPDGIGVASRRLGTARRDNGGVAWHEGMSSRTSPSST